MYKIATTDKDAYITNKLIRGAVKSGSNVGDAATLDLFKLYGQTFSGSTPNVELSRLLIHFDLSEMRSLISDKRLSIEDPSFWCKMVLKDVYGGQPTPSQFTIDVFPLSSSFQEGLGRDVTYYSDYDACNWISSSFNTEWYSPGCATSCDAQVGGGDVITSSISIQNTKKSQFFKRGDEDLEIDITSIVSATLSGEIPDNGFRIGLSESQENDSQSYYVKRFGSRTVYDESKRPKLIFGFDDSMTDDTQNATFDITSTVFVRNYAGGELRNITSGSQQLALTGSNCLMLKLVTEVSGGTYEISFSGSQFSYGSTGQCPVSGTYYSDVFLSSFDPLISQKLTTSSSIVFTPIWMSSDASVVYVTGSNLSFVKPKRQSKYVTDNFTVTITNLQSEYEKNEQHIVRVNIFDNSTPYVKVTKIPVELPGIVVKNVHYQIRDSVTNDIVIPANAPHDSTRVSSDAEGMFFLLDCNSLQVSKTYVVDMLIDYNGNEKLHKNVSSIFRVKAT